MPWGPSVNPRSSWFSTAWFFSQWNLAVYGDNPGRATGVQDAAKHAAIPRTDPATERIIQPKMSVGLMLRNLSQNSPSYGDVPGICPSTLTAPPPPIKVASGSVNVLRPVGCTWIKAEQPSVVLEKSLRQKSREITWHVGGTLSVCMP